MANKRNPAPPSPTDAELAILRVLWRLGPCTVRQVHDALNEDRPTGYTTALKFMQIMTEKGLLVRDERERSHVYRPSAPAEETRRGLVGEMLERAFAGAADQFVMSVLGAKKVTSAELAAIRSLLDEMERGTP